MLKRFYDNYGILGKLTEDVIIKIFKDLNFIATTDLTTNKIIKKEKMTMIHSLKHEIYIVIYKHLLKIYSKF
ncbi:hypothetical protein RNN91_04195 [Mycoplasmopsis felis]|uniref:hypothetical protein n=1 Tax=Mycoplasmopsis felis TaxID=33923 RepID=UPI002AF6C70B|nr:hypothetical protein [Mycoplasmopsis felis]WQQ02026.1 hypothetical protein RRG54_01555 [Mycoplasmopsis felis]WQQ06605.1 hypothetical protein RRG37_01995 [Mycoplasmopsis felis]WRX06322.1 hypothetical protein O7984_02150 [Mycoplasmopsis felis]